MIKQYNSSLGIDFDNPFARRPSQSTKQKYSRTDGFKKKDPLSAKDSPYTNQFKFDREGVNPNINPFKGRKHSSKYSRKSLRNASVDDIVGSKKRKGGLNRSIERNIADRNQMSINDFEDYK